MDNSPKIGIIGAGVIGLTTALMLKNEFRGLHVSVLADKFESETTSHVAAGVFRPSTNFCGPTPEITKKWVQNSWNHWNNLLSTSDAPLAGVTQLSGYIFTKKNKNVVRNHLIEDIVPIYRAATEEELTICGNDWKYGSFFSTLLIQNQLYLPWSAKRFKSLGGNILNKKINNFSEVAKDYDIIVNCTGLGAKTLCDDDNLVPIRGQVIKVKAPWVKMAFYGDYDAYILPGFGHVTLGGTRQYESYNIDVCKYDAMGIMDRCCELLPALRKAEVITHAVGLRPHRSPVRVEGEILKTAQGNIKIVHCYGHGGYGVTCAPGTTADAVKLIKDMLMTNHQAKL